MIVWLTARSWAVDVICEKYDTHPNRLPSNTHPVILRFSFHWQYATARSLSCLFLACSRACLYAVKIFAKDDSNLRMLSCLSIILDFYVVAQKVETFIKLPTLDFEFSSFNGCGFKFNDWSLSMIWDAIFVAWSFALK